ncbi:hypothetical protein MPSI1_001481 [Malassezia psittaci]|uniref:Uncharacterized protein n=1 Tax=Malassezia psittaci TaxID=1821823 RepID=A0AAF0F4G6_9BASI|nr:hypothetical protein MPSI1_001481 [Malassezia psittaci]
MSETPNRNDEVLRRLSVLHSNLAASAAKNQRSAAKPPPIGIHPGSESDASHDAIHLQKKTPSTLPTSVAVSSLLSVNESSTSSRRSSSDSSVSDNRYTFSSNPATQRVSTESAPPRTSVSSIVSSPQPLNWPHHHTSQPPGVRSTSPLPPLSDLFNKAHPVKKDLEHRPTSRSWPVNCIDPTLRPVIDERHRASYSVPLNHLTNGSSDSSHSANYMGPSFRPSYSNNASPSRYTPTVQFDMRWTNFAKQHSAGPATHVSYEPNKPVLLPTTQQARADLHETNHSFVGNASMTPLDQSSSTSTLGAMTPMLDSHSSRPLKKSRSIMFPGNASNSTPTSARRLSAHHLYTDLTEDHSGRIPRHSSLSGLPQYLKSGGPELLDDSSSSTHGTMETNRGYLDIDPRKSKWELPSSRHSEAVNCRQADMRSVSLSLPDQVPHRLGYHVMSRKRSIEEDAR